MLPVQPTINKITSPVISGIYPRTRLFHCLDTFQEKPIVWIQGPAGSGKSTLVASYLESRNLPHIWYHLDEGDSDCATLFYYMGLAADKIAPSDPTPLPLLTREYQQGLKVFTRRYFENLFRKLPSSSVIVLDDYNEVGKGSQFHEVVKYALEEIPPGIRVMVISREGPPPALARLRSNRRIGFITWEDLRLDPEEMGGVIQVYKDAPANEKFAGQFLEKTGGWLAGVVFMLESGDVGEIPAKSSPKATVLDYFACEVFDKTDFSMQSFLLRTAFMKQFTPRMAYGLTGNAAAGTILAELNARNFFIDKFVTDADLTYEYHPLFRQFLIHRAHEVFPENIIVEIKQVSAEILEEYGLADLAAELYISARSWSGISSLIQRVAPKLISQGRTATLESWMSEIPQDILDGSPWLLYWLGCCRFNGDFLEARSLFERSLELFRTAEEVDGIYLAWSGIANSYRHTMEDWRDLDYWVTVLDEIMTLYPVFPSPKVEIRLTISMFTALVLLQTEHQRIYEWGKRLEALLEHNRNTFLHVQAVYAMSIHELWNGNYGRMRLLLDSVRPLMSQPNIPPMAIIMVKCVEAFHYWVTAQGNLCRQAINEGLAIAKTSGIQFLNSRMLICKLQAEMIEDSVSQLEKCNKGLSLIQPQGNNMDLANYYLCCTMLSLLRDDVARAASCIDAAEIPLKRVGSLFHECLWNLGKARVLFAQQENDESLLQAAKALRLSQLIKSRNLEYMSLLIVAWILLCQKDAENDLVALRQAMVLGRKLDFEYCMWWDSRMIAALCVAALENGIEVEYVQRLVRRRQLMPAELPIACENWPWAVRVYTLGEFKLLLDDKPVQFSGKTPKKPIEMLKALIALGGGEKTEGQIADLLWPEVDGDTAKNSCKITLHRLRQLVGNEDFIQVRQGKLVIDRRHIWSDVAAFEQQLAAAHMQGESVADDEAIRLIEKALALFRGHFLAEDGDKPWTTALRARLKNKFILNTLAVGNMHQARGERKKALDCFYRGLEVNPSSEEIYQTLMQCNLASGLRAEVITTYRDCRLALAELGLAPSQRTKDIYTAALEE